MNSELFVLSRILQDGTIHEATELGVDASWMLAYRSTWDFIETHVAEYGGTPSLQSLRDVFPDLQIPKTEESIRWCVVQLANQCITQQLRVVQERIAQGLVDDELSPKDLLEEVLKQIYDASTKYEEARDRDIIHDYGDI